MKQVSEISIATLQPVVGRLLERHQAVHMQHHQGQIAFFFADSSNVIVASLRDQCLIDAELDSVDGFERAIEVISAGPRLFVIATKAVNSDKLYSHDPLRLEVVNEQRESERDETIKKTNFLHEFRFSPL